jgi:hypothetical protein
MTLKKRDIGKTNTKNSPERDLEFVTTTNLDKQPRGKIRQLNIQVPEETLRDFKFVCVARDIPMGRLWNLIWEEWRAKNP